MRSRVIRLLPVWLFAGALLLNAAPADKRDFVISKNYDVMHALFRELDQYYVDSVKPDKVLNSAINGMMSAFDPYTTYMQEDETADIKMLTTGEYAGVGAMIGPRNGKVIVLEPYEGMPAQKAGLQYGDVLLEIAGVKMVGSNQSKASELLKGQPGTTVKVLFTREGFKKPVEKTILRELIAVNQVVWHGLLNDKTGYINLSGFTGKSSQEVQSAFMDVKSQGATRLILDLRGNGGGLLDEAVNICNLFVRKGQEIVSTRGKLHQWDKIYKTTREPVDTVIPIVVLVNSGSASASEILAGALQDLDRAVIVGTRTYGKGLVQSTRSMPFNGMLKVTTAKYYIPSGRCIQAIDYSHRNEDGSVGRIPDSLTTEFSTSAGRKVRDGGGILPDVQCVDDRGSSLTYDLIDSSYFFDYANQYFRTHEKIAPVTDFKLTDAEYADFIAFVKNKGFKYTSPSKKALIKLREAIRSDSLMGRAATALDALEKGVDRPIEEEFTTFRDEIELMVSAEIVSRFYFQAGELRQSLKFDPIAKRALEVLGDGELYKKTLSPSKTNIR